MDPNSDSHSAHLYIENCIIPQGFTYEEFVQYLKTRKSNGDNLSLWNMDELIEEGNEFIARAPIRLNAKSITADSNQQLPAQYQYPSQSQIEAPQGQQPYIQKVRPGKPFIPNPQAFLQKNQNITCKIDSFEELPGGIFSKSYIAYKIILTPMGYIINRRYSDFDKLREYLNKNYPEYIIPPIPEKVNSKKPEILHYRQIALERFLNLTIKGFWFDPYVDAFFSAQNDNELIKLTKNIPNRICDCKQATTTNGQIEIQINSQIDNFFQSQLQAIDKRSDIFSDIKKKCKKLVDAHQNLSNEYRDFGFCIQQLLNNIKMQNENSIEKINEQPIQNVYNLFQNWSAKQAEIGEQFSKNIIYFCKYQHQIFETIKEKIRYRDTQKCNFEKQAEKLSQKKEKLFKEQNIQKWELTSEQAKQKDTLLADEQTAKSIMLPQESKLIEYLEDTYGYINFSLYNQVQKAMNYSLSQLDFQMQSILVSVKLLTYSLYDDYMVKR